MIRCRVCEYLYPGGLEQCPKCGCDTKPYAIPASRHIMDDGGGFDGLGLCPRCQGAETRNGNLCVVCQNEIRDDQS